MTTHEELILEAKEAQLDEALKQAAAKAAALATAPQPDHVFAETGSEYFRRESRNDAIIRLRAFADGKTHGLYGPVDIGYLTAEQVKSDLRLCNIEA